MPKSVHHVFQVLLLVLGTICVKSGAVLLFALPNAGTSPPVELRFLQNHGWKLMTVHSLSIVGYLC